MVARGILLAAVACVGLLTGCVDRRFVVTTNVPGAQITVDGKSIGPAPVDDQYLYAGWREIRAVAPGYEPTTKRVKFEYKWYDYPGLDLIAEVLWPFTIQDIRRVDLELQPARPLRNEELNFKAEELRARGLALPPASVPDEQPDPIDPGAGPRPRLFNRGRTPPPLSSPVLPPNTP
jgi:hypothetical protein